MNQIFGQGTFLESRITHAFQAFLDIHLKTDNEGEAYFLVKLFDGYLEINSIPAREDTLMEIKKGLLWADNPAAVSYRPISLEEYRRRTRYADCGRCESWAWEQLQKEPVFELADNV